MHSLLVSTWAIFLIDYMIIFNSFFRWDENFSPVCWNRGQISARFAVMKFLHIIIVILFTHFSIIMRDDISSWFEELKFQPRLKILAPYSYSEICICNDPIILKEYVEAYIITKKDPNFFSFTNKVLRKETIL